MWEITIALVVGILVLIYIYLTWYFDYWEKRGIRGPKPKILVGNFEKTRRGECNFVEELHDIYLKYKSTDRFVGIFTAKTPQLFILDPALAVQILTTNFSSFHDNEASMWTTPKMDSLRFTSPIMCIGEAWKERRMEFGPTSSSSRIRSNYPTMTKIGSKLSAHIQSHIQNIDIHEASRRYTAELMSNFIWGISFDDSTSHKLTAIYQAGNCMIREGLKCVRYYVQTAAWPWLRKVRPVRFFSKTTSEFFTQLTAGVAESRLKNLNDQKDVLSYLLTLQAKCQMSETQMVGYTTVLMMDGFETVGLVIDHCLMMLGRNKSAQDKLRREVLDNLNKDGNLAFETLNDLPYLDQCVYETLRLFPPLPTFFKICTAPFELENSDGTKIHLQPGDKVYISNYSFQHDEEFFKNAEEFIPERFDPEVGGTLSYRKMGVLLPFGDGPRICQGIKLALVEIKIALAEVVRKFEISVCPSTRKDNRIDPYSFLLSLEGGIRLKFKALS